MTWLTRAQALFAFDSVEDRLETTLFSQDFFLPFFELKASWTLSLFDRVPYTVAISDDKQHLYWMLDTDKSKPLSYAFLPISDSEINTIVNSLNRTAARYRKAGFDQVISSVIPNKITITEPNHGVYNHLIERVAATSPATIDSD